MIEVKLNAIGVGADAPDEEALKNGADPTLHLQVIGAVYLPFEMAPGQGPMPAPAVTVKFSLSKDAALKLRDQITEKAEKLPNKPRIDIAQSLQGVDEQAQEIQKLRDFSS
jgi:hypothetical protein